MHETATSGCPPCAARRARFRPGQLEGLLYPVVRGTRVTQDEALDTVAAGLSGIVSRHGPDAVAFYLPGQLPTEPEMKATPAAIEPVHMGRRSFVLARRQIGPPAGTWWARVAIEGGSATLFATECSAQAIVQWAPGLFGDATLAEYLDERGEIYRCAAFVGEELVGCLFVGPLAARPHWEAAKALFAGGTFNRGDRRLVLSGTVLGSLADAGPTICACFGIGLAVIRDAVLSGAATPEAIGAALRAGTNRGSCVPELRRIIARETALGAG